MSNSKKMLVTSEFLEDIMKLSDCDVKISSISQDPVTGMFEFGVHGDGLANIETDYISLWYTKSHDGSLDISIKGANFK